MGPHSRASIRPARPRDGATLSALQSHLRDPSPGLLSRALDASHRRAPATEAVGGSPLTALVSTVGDVPVGYVLAVGSGPVHVAELVVAPDHRREGRASALLRSVRDRCRHERVTLLVDPDNDPAVACYRRLGFVGVERRPDHYPDGDALLMTWEGNGEADR